MQQIDRCSTGPVSTPAFDQIHVQRHKQDTAIDVVLGQRVKLLAPYQSVVALAWLCRQGNLMNLSLTGKTQLHRITNLLQVNSVFVVGLQVLVDADGAVT